MPHVCRYSLLPRIAQWIEATLFLRDGQILCQGTTSRISTPISSRVMVPPFQTDMEFYREIRLALRQVLSRKHYDAILFRRFRATGPVRDVTVLR